MGAKSVSVTEVAARLRPWANALKIQLLPFTEEAVVNWAPFCSGLGYFSAIVYDPNTVATGVIHELGHLLFIGVDEYEWFGWEWEVAVRLGVGEQWKREQADYAIALEGVDFEFGDLYPQQQQKVLLERRQYARDHGYLRFLPEAL